MFHRIKSEPQDAVQKEENTAQDVQKNENTELTNEASEQLDAVQGDAKNMADDISPIEQYAAQQASLEEAQGKDEESANETSTTETINEPTQEEAETMNTTTENTTEEQTQEEASAYRAPSSVTGGYPGSYGGAAYAAPSAPTSDTPAATSAADNGRLVIGSGITMSGEIEACPHLVVEGTVEASLRGAEILEVSPGGIFFGTVEIAEATISGRFEGDITVTGRLTVTETGQVTGSITYGALEMEAGASVDGKLTPMKSAAATKSSAPAKARVSAPATQTSANDAQLFSNEAVAAAE